MAYDTGNSQYLSRLEAQSNRAILMVGAGAIGSVVLMFLVERIF
ncbi:hypothetical protein ACFQS7_30540 [Dankookia sp. GCM10030260]